MSGVDPLTDAQVERLKELLEKRRDEVEQSLAAAREESKPVGLDLPIGRLTRVDALQSQHMATARRERLELQLRQIRQALRKVDEGSYGECARCEEPIGFARLKARPETPFCVGCQK